MSYNANKPFEMVQLVLLSLRKKGGSLLKNRWLYQPAERGALHKLTRS